jgi:hypothetical protein
MKLVLNRSKIEQQKLKNTSKKNKKQWILQKQNLVNKIKLTLINNNGQLIT